MKKTLRVAALAAGLFLLAGGVWAKPHVYKWVEDQSAGSDQVLRESQASRVVPLSEAEALQAVRRVMTDDLAMALAEYHATRHRQDAETVHDTVLPEAVAGKTEVDLADETYRFVLEVRLKAYGQRTRVLAKASPLYRLRDAEKEDERDGEDAGSAVEVRVKAQSDAAVSLGPIYVEPLVGLPQDYQLEPLPDAADRAQMLVRAFLYLLDRRLSAPAAAH
jgi:hypothetical protein